MKYFLSIFLSVVSLAAFAGGSSEAATPTAIEIVQSGNAGVMVYGAFGNAGGCSATNKIFIKASAPQYNQIYSTVLAAFLSGKKVRFYTHDCQAVPWYTAPDVSYNTVTEAGAVSLTN